MLPNQAFCLFFLLLFVQPVIPLENIRNGFSVFFCLFLYLVLAPSALLRSYTCEQRFRPVKMDIWWGCRLSNTQIMFANVCVNVCAECGLSLSLSYYHNSVGTSSVEPRSALHQKKKKKKQMKKKERRFSLKQSALTIYIFLNNNFLSSHYRLSSSYRSNGNGKACHPHRSVPSTQKRLWFTFATWYAFTACCPRCGFRSTAQQIILSRSLAVKRALTEKKYSLLTSLWLGLLN